MNLIFGVSPGRAGPSESNVALHGRFVSDDRARREEGDGGGDRGGGAERERSLSQRELDDEDLLGVRGSRSRGKRKGMGSVGRRFVSSIHTRLANTLPTP